MKLLRNNILIVFFGIVALATLTISTNAQTVEPVKKGAKATKNKAVKVTKETGSLAKKGAKATKSKTKKASKGAVSLAKKAAAVVKKTPKAATSAAKKGAKAGVKGGRYLTVTSWDGTKWVSKKMWFGAKKIVSKDEKKP